MNAESLKRLKDAVIGCIDVGRDQGWFVLAPDGSCSHGTQAEGYRDCLGTHLRSGRLCVVGIEAAGFLPSAFDFTAGKTDYTRLTRARLPAETDGQSRPWSVQAGKAATWRALPLVPALLSDLRQFVVDETRGHLDFSQASAEATRLLLFEAFVTTAPRRQTPPEVPECVSNACSHVWDAAVAVLRLKSQLADEQIISAIHDKVSISLFGAALLATGWSSDPALASHPVHVVRAFKPTRDHPTAAAVQLPSPGHRRQKVQ